MHEPASTAFFATEERLYMSRMNRVILVVVSLALVLILSGVVPHIEPATSNDCLPSVQPVDNPQPDKKGFSSGTPHGPIVITSNANFAATALAEGWPGNGSSSNPYIIDGLDIDRGGGAGHCISITNTGVYFVISNCSLTGANATLGAGIYLFQVSNARIANNILYNNYFGIHLYWGTLSTVVNNDCSANGEGIWLNDSDDNTVANNTCIDNSVGIHIEDSANAAAINNTCRNNTGIGIRLDWASFSATLTNNTSIGNSHGIYIDSDTYGSHTVLWNAFANNSVANAEDHDGSTLFDYNYWSDYAGVDANRDCIGDTSHGFPGGTDPHPLMLPPNRPMLAWDESFQTVATEIGEPFRYDLNATIYGRADHWWLANTVNFDIDQEGVITNATVLPLGPVGFTVHVNDTFGHVLSGIFTVVVEDLVSPIWSESAMDQSIECGESLHYDLNATDNVGLSTWWLNYTTHFAISNEGIVGTRGIVPVGVYGLRVWVNDTSNNVIDTTFTVTVIDTKPPLWVETPQNQTVVSGISFVCDFDATDPSGIAEWWVDDSVHFTIDWTGRLRTIGILQPGAYGLRVYVSDIHGHTLWTAILVEVTPATTTTTTTTETTTTTTTTSQTTTDTQIGIDPTMTLILGTGIGGAAVIVIVLIVLRRSGSD